MEQKQRRKRIVVGMVISLLCSSGAQRIHAHSIAHEQESNNDRVMAVQKYGGVQKGTGEVKVIYHGHMAFKITSPRGLRVFTDPRRNDPTGVYGLWYQMLMPKTYADIALVTHAHFDHDATERLDAAMILERMAGQFQLGDVRILGIAEKHKCEEQGKYPMRSAVIAAIDKDPCPPEESMQWNIVCTSLKPAASVFCTG